MVAVFDAFGFFVRRSEKFEYHSDGLTLEVSSGVLFQSYPLALTLLAAYTILVYHAALNQVPQTYY